MDFDRTVPAPGRARMVWEVAALVHAVADALAARFSAITVRGELAGFNRAPSGHCYFTLKDAQDNATLRCAMFRRAASMLQFAPGDGDLVEVRGRLALYEPRGELQLVVESMQPAGAGALYAQFLRLKARLEAEGLFDAQRKRPIFGFPRRLGVVSSLSAAALHDVVTALARRAPHVEVIVYPSPVQGAEAPEALVRAIATASRRAEVDTLLVCRGGGSLEDLWAFNDERVVRAVVDCSMPVISGVGHETDFTLTDFAADLRAPTPTAAAELAAPRQDACLGELLALSQRASQHVYRALETHGQRLDRAALRLSRPAAGIAAHRQRLALLAHAHEAALRTALRLNDERLARLRHRLDAAGRRRRDAAAQRLALVEARLRALDPRQVLSRGYAWIADARGHAVTSVAQLQPGQEITATMADGEAAAQVLRTTIAR